MRAFKCGVVLLLAVFTGSAMAATAKSTVRFSKGVTESGEAYQVYTVRCSDRSEVPITFWKASKQWCLGELAKEQCTKKKIKAANNACKTV